ncbi:hypothetical protein NHL50_06385 [Acidimicrobiia bacterium EGI L10123]|uniref:SPW repeat domain-containing protein n=1 Tax=Salinilacustrithrix flava TaxID=2957203 RepID=UPI003D7C1F6B|nr:hypothetical protein [Acidimicrobiia bacterium EGI L10123]
MSTRILARSAAVLIGIWLEAASAVLGYGTPAANVDRVLGPVAGGIAFVAIWAVAHPIRWATVPAGALLVLAPVLGYPLEAAVSSVLSGLAIIALAFVGGDPSGDYGGGWQALWRGRERSCADG